MIGVPNWSASFIFVQHVKKPGVICCPFPAQMTWAFSAPVGWAPVPPSSRPKLSVSPASWSAFRTGQVGKMRIFPPTFSSSAGWKWPRRSKNYMSYRPLSSFGRLGDLLIYIYIIYIIYYIYIMYIYIYTLWMVVGGNPSSYRGPWLVQPSNFGTNDLAPKISLLQICWIPILPSGKLT